VCEVLSLQHTDLLPHSTFYFQRILPRASGHAACVENGSDSMMALDADDFAF